MRRFCFSGLKILDVGRCICLRARHAAGINEYCSPPVSGLHRVARCHAGAAQCWKAAGANETAGRADRDLQLLCVLLGWSR